MMNAAPGSGDVYLKVTGADSYVEIASIADYGIPTTGALSVAAWMRPDTLNFSALGGNRLRVLDRKGQLRPAGMGISDVQSR